MKNRMSTVYKTIIFVVIMCFHHQSSAMTTTEVCYRQSLSASCTSGTVIMIDSAIYGRMQLGGKCRTLDEHVGCSTDVRPYVERQCAGKRRCDMLVSDGIRSWASDNNGCPIFLPSYLRVTYYCLRVYEGYGERCGSHPLMVVSSNAYLANIVTVESRQGSLSCPWLIRVSHGQTVNLTLFDFAVQEDRPTTQDFSGDQPPHCQIYARMYFSTAAEPTIVCRGNLRQRVLHTHTGRQDIRIAITSSQQHYLLHVKVNEYGTNRLQPDLVEAATAGATGSGPGLPMSPILLTVFVSALVICVVIIIVQALYRRKCRTRNTSADGRRTERAMPLTTTTTANGQQQHQQDSAFQTWSSTPFDDDGTVDQRQTSPDHYQELEHRPPVPPVYTALAPNVRGTSQDLHTRQPGGTHGAYRDEYLVPYEYADLGDISQTIASGAHDYLELIADPQDDYSG